MPRIFAYIAHKNGVPDDSAAELAAVAKKIDGSAAATAMVVGSGPALDRVCAELQKFYSEVWKVSNKSFSYPNAELIRRPWVKIVPAGSVTLALHDHFGMDLAPGLSIKLNAAFVSDVTAIGEVEGNALNLVRQEFGGQVNAHVKCDTSSGAVITIRPGTFKAVENASAAGIVPDKSGGGGELRARRRH